MTAPVESARRRNRLSLLGLGVFVVALVGMWVYIYGFADTTNPNRLPDQTWAKRAEQICKSYSTQINALPKAPEFASIKPKSEALRQRAVVGQDVTDLLANMVRDLKAAPPPVDADSRHGVDGWLADYDIYLGDRQRHMAAWAAGQDPSFAETAINGKPITQGMDDFSNANGMSDCQVPQDLG